MSVYVLLAKLTCESYNNYRQCQGVALTYPASLFGWARLRPSRPNPKSLGRGCGGEPFLKGVPHPGKDGSRLNGPSNPPPASYWGIRLMGAYAFVFITGFSDEKEAAGVPVKSSASGEVSFQTTAAISRERSSSA